MRLARFGATGRTGRLVVQDALAQGHEVVAFVRSADKLSRQQVPNARLSVVEGDVRDAAAVARAVEGVDAVVSVLAPVRDQPGVQTDGTVTIVEAMRQHGVERIVSLTGAGVDAPGDAPRPLGGRLVKGVMGLVVGWVLRDGQGHADALYASDRDWAVVRPPRLTDGPPTGAARHGRLPLGAGDSVRRADVADFLLTEGPSRRATTAPRRT